MAKPSSDIGQWKSWDAYDSRQPSAVSDQETHNANYFVAHRL
jgi:hypothetical protein